VPKSAGGLWDGVTAFENLYGAYLAARKGKRYSDEVLEFGFGLEEKLFDLQGQMVNGVWRPGRPREFMVRDPKPRLISAPPFADRVVHHAVVRVIEPVLERRFIFDSYACRKGRGVHTAVDRLQRHLREASREGGKVWVLKADISKYFASINHGRLMAILGRSISDKKVLWLCRTNLKGYGFDEGVGIPVGALTSQLFANIYLDQLDHWIKDELGIKRYVRYMDDFVIVGHSKADLWALYDAIADFLATRLALRLNRKTTVLPASGGIDFCGYRTWTTHLLPRKRNVKKARATFRELAALYRRGEVSYDQIRPFVASFLGYMKHCSSRRTVEGILEDFVLTPPPVRAPLPEGFQVAA
jgi:retron-type reverse transcriptase